MKIQQLLSAGALATLGVLTTGVSQQAMAASMTATLTADNHYALFTGNASGTEWGFVGRNEKGAGGRAQSDFVYNEDGSYNSTYIGEGVTSGDIDNGGRYNWSMPEEWTFDVEGGEYVYVVVWDDSSVTESWIGEFASEALGDDMLLSQADDWEYLTTITQEGTDYGINPGDAGDTPDIEDLVFQVAAAYGGTENSWSEALKKGDNGIKPWGDFSSKGISSEADFLYTTTDNAGQAGGNNEKYTIFRTQASVFAETPESEEVPEPGALLGLALLGFTALSSKRHRESA